MKKSIFPVFFSASLCVFLLASCKTTRLGQKEAERVTPEAEHSMFEVVEEPVQEAHAPQLDELPPVKKAEEGHTLEHTDVDQGTTNFVVESYIESMSIHQRIGQRFISKIEGTELSEQIVSLIQRENIGGIIIYPWNVTDVDQVRALTDGIQRIAMVSNPSIKLFICVDQEGGRVNAFKLRETSQLASPFYWARHQDPEYVRAAAYVIASEIRTLGCNMNFAPVLDLYEQPDKTIIGDRSMGADPEVIGNLGKAYIEGAKEAGIIPVAKHFPGHGSSTVDSHHSLPVIEIDEITLREKDIKPFVEVIQGGVDAIMTAHVLFTQIDPEYPVTLSSHILRKILREEYGFQGIVISDGMSMGALSNNFEITETLRLMFKAGIDLILVHHKYDLANLKDRVYELYEQGEITEQEINEGVERILKVKQKYGLLTEESNHDALPVQ